MSNLKDGIDNVVVRLDNEDATFRVGTPLSGKVMVSVTSRSQEVFVEYVYCTLSRS